MSGNLPGTLPMASGGAHAIGPTDAAHGDGNVHAQAPAPEAAGPAATAAVAQVAGARSAGWPGFRRVATVLERDPASAERRVARAAEAADVVEVRLDAVWTSPPDPDAATDLLLRLRGATTRPLLATLRPRRQGGHFEGAEGARLGLLAAARLAGFDAIDVEDDNQDLGSLLRALRQDETPVVLSRHLAAPLPCRDDLLSLLLRQQDHGGALHKLAFDAGSYLDFLRALELAHTHAARGGKPCILPLGYGGAEGRALLSLAGNRAAYGHDGEGGVPG
ncbi:MAG TPA: type I 3-dehydroquinate dehydratase, partial [Candidatus Thermoplasmatota archaeon]|nr:type I 3-dehydroquinate dehydratase [Candidatus Thermoplasmatota archaeon]